MNRKSFLQLISFVLLISNFAFAQSTYTFTNVSGNAWSTAANWSPSYPGTSITVDDQVYINGVCEVDVTISNAGLIFNSDEFSINNGITFTNDALFTSDYSTVFNCEGSIINNDLMVFEGDGIEGVSLDFSGTWTNNTDGRVFLNPDGFSFLTIPAGSTVTNHGEFYSDQNIKNGGTVVNTGLLSLNGEFANAEDPDLATPINPGVLTNSGSIIQNFGWFQNSSGSFTNDGKFTCNYNTIFSSVGTIINNDSMFFIGDGIEGVQLVFSGILTNNEDGRIFINANDGFSFLNINSGSTLTNHGEIHSDQTIWNGGTLTNTGLLNLNAGFANSDDPDFPSSPGVFTNSGTVNNYLGFDNSTGNLTNDGKFTSDFNTVFNSEGTIINNDTMIFEGDGSEGVELAFSGTWTNNADGYIHIGNRSMFDFMLIPLGSTLTNHGELISDYAILNGGTCVNSGELILNGGFGNAEDPDMLLNPGVFTSSGTVENNLAFGNSIGSVTNDGKFTCSIGSFFTNEGTVINNDTIINNGSFDNSAKIINSSVIISSGTLTNTDTLINTGELNMQGTLANTGGVINLINSGQVVFNNTGTWPAGVLNWISGSVVIGPTGNMTLANSLTLESSHFLRINPGGMLSLNAGKTLTNGGVMDISGTLTNNGTFVNTADHYIDCFGALINNSTLTNTGILTNYNSINNSNSFVNTGNFTNFTGTFTNSGTISNDSIFNNNGGSTIINSGTITNKATRTLSSFGGISNSSGGIINNIGTLEAIKIVNNGSIINDNLFINYDSLTNNNVFTNNGRLKNFFTAKIINNSSFVNNDTLENNSILYNNTNGTLTNNLGSTIDNTDQIYNIGTLNNLGTMTIVSFLSNTGTLSNTDTISIGGQFDNSGTMTNTKHLSITGALNNHGTLSNNIGGTLSNTTTGVLTNASGSNLNNYGTLFNSNFLNNSAGGILTNHLEGTIDNFNQIYNIGTLNNIGSLNNPSYFSNTGTLSNTGMLTISGGQFDNHGTLNNNSNDLVNTGYFENFTNGKIKGTGTFTQSGALVLASGSSVEPGNSIGTQSISGDLDLASSAYIAEIDAQAATTDLITVSGNATLTNASLTVDWLTTPIVGATYTVMTFDSKVGEFATVTIPAVPGGIFTTAYTATTVSITISGPLPVELVSFTAQTKNQMVLLEWHTASEENNRGFYVERNSTTDGEWTEIGFVQGQGTQVNRNDYSLLDKYPDSGTNYYRLRQVDFDGDFEYSKVVAADVNTETGAMKIAPNPVRGGVASFYLESTNSGDVLLEMFSLTGQKVYEQAFYLEGETERQVAVDLSAFAAGVYLVRMEIGEKVVFEKLIME